MSAAHPFGTAFLSPGFQYDTNPGVHLPDAILWVISVTPEVHISCTPGVHLPEALDGGKQGVADAGQ